LCSHGCLAAQVTFPGGDRFRSEVKDGKGDGKADANAKVKDPSQLIKFDGLISGSSSSRVA
jgi:hypothetical protein